MVNSYETRYGPNWRIVKAYIEKIPVGFIFNNLGQKNVTDESVKRVLGWGELKKTVSYAIEDASPENCDYLRFLDVVWNAHFKNNAISEQNELASMVNNAINDAGTEYADHGGDWDDQFDQFVFSVPDDTYPFWRFSIQDHCAFIATELVVGHITKIHLLRDMWHWYSLGHWPCGWEGDWPDGRLIVF